MAEDEFEVADISGGSPKAMSLGQLADESGLPAEWLLAEYRRLVAEGKSMTIAELQAKYAAARTG